MGKHLAKMPQQRIRAPQNHPTLEKLEKLFDYMDDLGLIIKTDLDRIYVTDEDRPEGEDWEIRDIINSDYLVELPCQYDEYKLTRTVDIAPRQAQPAPENPASNSSPPSGLNHFKTKPPQKKQQQTKKRPKLATVMNAPPVPVTPTIPARKPVQTVDPRVTTIPRGKK